jgi:hypothetical protein
VQDGGALKLAQRVLWLQSCAGAADSIFMIYPQGFIWPMSK